MQTEEIKTTGQKPATILIVEDVVTVATVLEARLESFGYSVCAIAQSGAQAVERALECKPDLILMDILLAGDMNGIEAAERITSKMDVPVIFLSCVNDRQVIEQALRINSYGFILKPYDSVELNFSIQNALSKHQQDRESKARIAELEKRCSRMEDGSDS
jgi:CheY-like chemotaxis protein